LFSFFFTHQSSSLHKGYDIQTKSNNVNSLSSNQLNPKLNNNIKNHTDMFGTTSQSSSSSNNNSKSSNHHNLLNNSPFNINSHLNHHHHHHPHQNNNNTVAAVGASSANSILPPGMTPPPFGFDPSRFSKFNLIINIL